MERDFNTPETRQRALRGRLAEGGPLVHARLAEEFGVSVDTIRRDLLALEAEGVVTRVRGGALPVAPPAAPLPQRIATEEAAAERIARAALPLVEDGMVLMLDGGTTVLRLARALPPLPKVLAVTPAPAVAMAMLEKGIETIVVGGRLSRFGGVAVGHSAERMVADIAADLCLLGACGLDNRFGLGADDAEEAALKRAMARASARTAVLTGAAKLGRRARHRVLPASALDLLLTDAEPALTDPLAQAGLEIRHV